MDRYEIQTKVDGKWQQHGAMDMPNDTAAISAWHYLAGTLTDAARLIGYDYKGRIRVLARQAARKGFRVTYGETMPVWSRVLPTKVEADAFAAKHRSFGDIVFGIEAV